MQLCFIPGLLRGQPSDTKGCHINHSLQGVQIHLARKQQFADFHHTKTSDFRIFVLKNDTWMFCDKDNHHHHYNNDNNSKDYNNNNNENNNNDDDNNRYYTFFIIIFIITIIIINIIIIISLLSLLSL